MTHAMLVTCGESIEFQKYVDLTDEATAREIVRGLRCGGSYDVHLVSLEDSVDFTPSLS